MAGTGSSRSAGLGVCHMLAGPQCDHKHPAEATLTAQCSKPPWTNERGWRPPLGMPEAELRLTEFSVLSG